MDADWIRKIARDPDLMRMGHSQSAEDDNLGFGWVYYGLARAYRPRHVVCIGSFRGFVPMMFAKALVDNRGGGRVTFVDPSFVDGFWTDPEAVRAWFLSHGLDNIDHHRMTTQDFAASEAFAALPTVDFLFVDGFHSAEQAEFDHKAFARRLNPDGLVFFHDSVSAKMSGIYGEDGGYAYTVHEYVARLARSRSYQVLDIPFADGLSIVRRRSKVSREKQPDSLYAPAPNPGPT